MNPYLSHRYQNDTSTALGRAAAMSNRPDDLIDLSIGDPDFNTDLRIIQLAFNDAANGYTHYTHARGDSELRNEICRFYLDDYNIELSDSEIFISASGCLAMHLVLEAILNDGDEVLIPSPYFTPYAQQVKLARGKVVEVPTFDSEGFTLTPNAVRNAVTPRSRALIINSPCNPTGACLNIEQKKEIIKIAREYDLILIADDIYTAFSYGEPFAPIISLEGARERTITINSFSKNYMMSGWRIGNIIAAPDIIDVITSINENIVFTAPSISQRAALYALRMRKELIPPIVETFRKRTESAVKRIRFIPRMTLPFPPKGTFYLFPDIKKTGLTSDEAASYILQNAHVLTVPGNAFGKYGEGFLRLALTSPTNLILEALNRIAQLPRFQL